MRKKLPSIAVTLFIALLAPASVHAAGGFSVSTLSLDMHPGETATFSVTANNSVGRINLESSNDSIASIDSGSIFLDEDSKEITVEASGVGTVTITVTATSNFATYDEEILDGQSYEIEVNVTEEARPDENPDENPEDTPDAIDGQEGAASTIEGSTNAPDTGGNLQKGDNSTPIILTSVVGASFAVFIVALFFIRKRRKQD